jgi:molybdopterin-guanine dinucleotide biosynthesis protein MobB
VKVFGVIGWKNSGKTTLMERLVAEITARGFSVSTIKHAHHGVDVDQPGRDTYRHRVAGAQEVILSSPVRVAVMSELRGAAEPGLEDLLGRLAPVDLVLVEGFKRESHHKIEAHRRATGQPLIAPGDGTVRAVASDAANDLAYEGRVFDLDDIAAIAGFVLAEAGL